MPTVRMPMALAVAATTGAAPLPVPPPMPACSSSSVLGTGQVHAGAAPHASLPQHRADRGRAVTVAADTVLLSAHAIASGCAWSRSGTSHAGRKSVVEHNGEGLPGCETYKTSCASTLDCNELPAGVPGGPVPLCTKCAVALWDRRCVLVHSSRLQASAPYTQQPPW